MSPGFAASELINIAIGIEKRGFAFYSIMARSIPGAAARSVFQYLAGVEKDHIKTFQGMLSGVEKYDVPEVFAGEYAAYFHALVDSAVFTRELTKGELASCSGNDITALELGIRAEKDSILFYYNMKDLVSLPERSTVDKIISEEKAHLRQLTELKKQLENTG